MNKKTILMLLIPLLALASVAVVTIISNKEKEEHVIELDFTMDEFKFMNHSIAEGDQFDVLTKNIPYSNGTDSSLKYYRQHGAVYNEIMCPSISDKEGLGAWMSGYISGDGKMASITAYKKHTNLDEWYKGPIQIGDSMDEVEELMHIKEIKKYGEGITYRVYRTYHVNSNQGPLVFVEKTSTTWEEYKNYKSKDQFLADGYKIYYIFRYDQYWLVVAFDESKTVCEVGATYDPEHLFNNYYLPEGE